LKEEQLMSRSTIPAVSHQVGDRLHGFTITGVTPIPDIKALALQATHDRTGAELLHVHCHDEENLFSVGFRTPPSDSTGVAHILEHCVLAGSEKFPVKDAFNELGKRTLNTFLNAMTWPDRTVYPVCSPVKADYFHLAEVYADLVFHPLITKQTFQREGHHLEVAEDGSSLEISGVVFNEMKGVYAAPENFILRELNQQLLPDTPYGVDSGGDPAVIPTLTYEAFVDFHRRFYSPSNARFLLYGDIPLEENLAFLEKVLGPFGRVEVDSALPLQPSWEAPRRLVFDYPVGADKTELKGESFAVVSWLLGETKDVLEVLKLEIAFFALSGSAAGPMRKALIDSGLGKDLFPGQGFDADMRQCTAAFGLRGTDPEHLDAVEALVMDTLARVVAENLDEELIEASFHHVAFHTREIVPPFPLMILYRVNPPWYFGGDPKAGLAFGEALEALRAQYAENPRLFVEALDRWLIQNPHRLTALAKPSNTLQKEWEAQEAASLAALRASLDEGQVAQIRAEAEALRAGQEEPDSEEALASLPQLALEEIPRRVFAIPTQVEVGVGGVEVLSHEVFSNGIGYVGVSFDAVDLSDEEALLLPLLGRATLGLGAGSLDYEQMARRVARHLGGISAAPMTGRHLETGARYELLHFDAKVLPHKIEALVGVLRDVWMAPRVDERKRLRDLVQESAARSMSRLIPRGHSFAYTRAAATLDATLWRQEQWGGVTQLQHLSALARACEQEEAVEALASKLAALQRKLFCRARAALSVAGDPDLVAALRPALEALIAELPEGEPAGPDQARAPSISTHTGVVIGGPVNYVAQVLPVPGYLDPASPALELMTQVLSSDLLYAKLRVQGGAYGGFAIYQRDSGILALASYRDPNLTETFAVYDQVAAWLRSDQVDDAAIDATRIGAIGSFDRILSPAQQLGSGLVRRRMGLTDERRAAFRDGLFAVDAAQLRALALPHLEAALHGAPRAALASLEKLEAANTQLNLALEIIYPDRT
jgi:Zn-dependent M16 (insulinase) family peptidase